MKITRMSVIAGGGTVTLETAPGLNVIPVADREGALFWREFLERMFFGGTGPAPFTAGRIDLTSGGRALTLARITQERTKPLAAFMAMDTADRTPVDEITGENCAERILHRTRESFPTLFAGSGEGEEARAEDADSAVMRKLTQLLKDEGDEFLPAAEAYLREFGVVSSIDRFALEEQLRTRAEAIQKAERVKPEAAAAAAALEESRTALDDVSAALEGARSGRDETVRELQEAADAEVKRLEERVRHLKESVAHLPENAVIGRLRGDLVNLETSRRSSGKKTAYARELTERLGQAETAVNTSPFAGQTPEEARAAARKIPKPPRVGLLKFLLPGAILGALAGWIGAQNGLLPLAPLRGAVCGAVLLAVLFAIIALALYFSARRSYGARLRQYCTSCGAERPEEILERAGAYCQALDYLEKLHDENAKTAAEADEQLRQLKSAEVEIINEVRQYFPQVVTPKEADDALRGAAQTRRRLTAAKEELEGLKARAAALRDENYIPDEERSLMKTRDSAAGALESAEARAEELSRLSDDSADRREARVLRERLTALLRDAELAEELRGSIEDAGTQITGASLHAALRALCGEQNAQITPEKLKSALKLAVTGTDAPPMLLIDVPASSDAAAITRLNALARGRQLLLFTTGETAPLPEGAALARIRTEA